MEQSPAAPQRDQDLPVPRGLWSWIRERINLALYCPQPAEGVVSSRLNGREGVYYVLRTADASNYLKLTERDHYLWTQMDGQRSVKDLVVAYFLQFGAFAFDRVGQLVQELRKGGFLDDRPLEVLSHIQEELAEREFVSRGRQLTSAFVHHEILFPGVDVFLQRLYHYTFWIFTWPFQLLLLFIIVAGLFYFVQTTLNANIPLLTVGGSYWLGLLTLLAIHGVIILFHELAHGLTTKHFGRRVRRGGFMIYYGYPAFFVDTMDMWLEGRWARVAVSWAGPHSGLVVGGTCALLMQVFPASPVTAWLYKTAFLAYLSVFLNLNPLLELDGYFILIDLLDIPMLRRRAFTFVRHQLSGELRGVWRKWRAGQAGWLADFTHEERLLAIFGLLAAAYTVYSAWLALYFWQTQLLTSLRELWNAPVLLNKLLLALLLVAVVIPLLVGLLAQLVAWGRRGWTWLERKGVFERDLYVNSSVAVIVGVLVSGPIWFTEPWWTRYVVGAPPLLFVAAAIAFVRIARRYQGSDVQRFFWTLLVSVGLLGLVAIQRLLTYVQGAPVAWSYEVERLAALPLALAGFLGLTGVDLRRGSWWERGMIATILLVAGLVVVPIARWTADLPSFTALVSVGAPYLTLIFLATVLPNLVSFAETRFFVPWLALTSAAVLTGVLFLLPVLVNVRALSSGSLLTEMAPPTSDWERWLALLTAGLWALAAVLYDLAGARVRVTAPAWPDVRLVSEEERLRRAFARFFDGLFAAFRDAFGRRRAQAVDDDLDVLSVTADWDIEIDAGRVRDEMDLNHMTLWEQADRYRDVLARAVDLIDGWSGRPFVRRAAQAAYDSLPWPERESLERYVLPGTDWGAAIASQFAMHRDVRWRLVRALPLFRHCDERALNLIVAALQSRHVLSDTVLARQGARADRFILIQSGEIEVWRRDGEAAVSQPVGELRRGASLGDQTFFGDGKYEATYRTATPTVTLVLDRAACERLLRSGVALATRVGASLQVVQLLGGMPMFAHLSPQQLGDLAHRLRRRTTASSQILVHVGQERHSLFIVLEGVVEALTDGKRDRTVTQVYTSGEHFGEQALFADTPYRFTYRTRGPAVLLTLDEATFDGLVAQSKRMASYVEQVASGRMLMR